MVRSSGVQEDYGKVVVKPMTEWEDKLVEMFKCTIPVASDIEKVSNGIAISHFSVLGDISLKINGSNYLFNAVDYFELVNDELIVGYVLEKFWRRKPENIVLEGPQLRISPVHFFEFNLRNPSVFSYHVHNLESHVEKRLSKRVSHK